MTRRILAALTGALRDAPREAPVHFHAGPTGEPAVCHDQRCPNPRLHLG
jgi:hypothetical protein